MGGQRFDIQFLRGIAVLLVVVFHAVGDLFPYGFLGVDIFFVISGYLITGLVLRDLEAGTFTFRRFYLRRARRLLPAAYSTFIGATIIAAVLLTSDQWWTFLATLLGAIDLGLVGICVHTSQPNGTARQWDLRGITGVTQIGSPAGWQE